MSTTAKLRALFDAITDTLTEACKSQVIKDENGNDQTMLPSAAHIANGIALLKNNNITADPETNEKLATLKSQLVARRVKREIPKMDLDPFLDNEGKDLMQ